LSFSGLILVTFPCSAFAIGNDWAIVRGSFWCVQDKGLSNSSSNEQKEECWCTDGLPTNWEVYDVRPSTIDTSIRLRVPVEKIGLSGNGLDYDEQKYLSLWIEKSKQDRIDDVRNSVAGILEAYEEGYVRRFPEKDFMGFVAYEDSYTPIWIQYIDHENDIGCREPFDERRSHPVNPFIECRMYIDGRNFYFTMPSKSKSNIYNALNEIRHVYNRVGCRDEIGG
jgi:hypothetical protein